MLLWGKAACKVDCLTSSYIDKCNIISAIQKTDPSFYPFFDRWLMRTDSNAKGFPFFSANCCNMIKHRQQLRMPHLSQYSHRTRQIMWPDYQLIDTRHIADCLEIFYCFHMFNLNHAQKTRIGSGDILAV